MPTLQEILANREQYADNLNITIGEAQVPLGSLRDLTAAEQSRLTNLIKATDETKRDAESRLQTAIETARKAEEAYAAAQEMKRTAGIATPPPGTNPLDDPFFTPIRGEFDKRDKSIAELKEELKKAINMATNMGTIGLEDRWDNQYSSLNFSVLPKDKPKPTRQELINFATQNKLIDRHNIPSIGRAWEEMSKSYSLDAERVKARQEGIEEGRRMSLAASVQQPGSSGPAPLAGSPKYTNGDVLGDLTSEALKDPEIRGMMEQLQRAGNLS
jgi:hypothetical protein